MTHSIPASEASRLFAELLEKVMRGDEILITRDDKPIARLLPASDVKRPRQFGRAKGKIEMSDDFDAPLDDFKGYM